MGSELGLVGMKRRASYFIYLKHWEKPETLSSSTFRIVNAYDELVYHVWSLTSKQG